mmetsp:Transcript_3389/g.11765  ORF Transcript_3389/g.11765 Transcript_3389/m.11765 type:complete len:235 (-) Transcript_3389:501-1205(-)
MVAPFLVVPPPVLLQQAVNYLTYKRLRFLFRSSVFCRRIPVGKVALTEAIHVRARRIRPLRHTQGVHRVHEVQVPSTQGVPCLHHCLNLRLQHSEEHDSDHYDGADEDGCHGHVQPVPRPGAVRGQRRGAGHERLAGQRRECLEDQVVYAGYELERDGVEQQVPHVVGGHQVHDPEPKEPDGDDCPQQHTEEEAEVAQVAHLHDSEDAVLVRPGVRLSAARDLFYGPDLRVYGR